MFFEYYAGDLSAVGHCRQFLLTEPIKSLKWSISASLNNFEQSLIDFYETLPIDHVHGQYTKPVDLNISYTVSI